MSDQPTILVKKADGTSVRMTMDEFKAYRGSAPASKPASAPVAPVQKKSKPVIIRAPQSSENKKNPVQWSDDDHVSPLTESRPVAAVAPLATPTTLDERALAIMSSLTTPIAPHLKGRLQSLLYSRLKDIRTEAQLQEYLMRSEANGGMGMSIESMQEVMAALGAVVPKKPGLVQKTMARAKTSAPVQPIAVPTPRPVIPIMPATESSGLPRLSQAKPVVHDMVAKDVEKTSVGPIDELETFSTDDFHRLAGTTSERQMKLLQKFEFLRSESYLLYREGVDAWQKSPLYRAYQSELLGALGVKQSLEAFASTNKQSGALRPEEIKAIIEVNQRLVA